MKPIFIIDTYPATLKQIEILNECIDAIDSTLYDKMIVSHIPIDTETCKKVDFVIYDKDNTFLPNEMTPYFWLDCQQFIVNIYNGGHTLPICRNIKNSIKLAAGLGYREFLFTESDVILHPEDLEKINGYFRTMREQGKEMILFRPEEYRGTNNSYVYETLLFGGNVHFFNNKFRIPVDVHEWISFKMGYTLEQTFYEKLYDEEDRYLIINNHSSVIFDKSQVNLSRYGLFNCEVVHNELHESEPMLFIMNSLIEESAKYITIYLNDNEGFDVILHNRQYWFNSYKFDGTTIKVDVFYDSEKQYLYETKTFVLTPENSDKFKTKGIIKLK